MLKMKFVAAGLAAAALAVTAGATTLAIMAMRRVDVNFDDIDWD